MTGYQSNRLANHLKGCKLESCIQAVLPSYHSKVVTRTALSFGTSSDAPLEGAFFMRYVIATLVLYQIKDTRCQRALWFWTPPQEVKDQLSEAVATHNK